mmetsp:Transcript_36540/g.79565  ORF Transcript_36540/g.79565 Transcript_36540/m.79565 type:complete len:121 (+) Transcript_36540:600-962(+)
MYELTVWGCCDQRLNDPFGREAVSAILPVTQGLNQRRQSSLSQFTTTTVVVVHEKQCRLDGTRRWSRKVLVTKAMSIVSRPHQKSKTILCTYMYRAMPLALRLPTASLSRIVEIRATSGQ